jgi:hypothetical protein
MMHLPDGVYDMSLSSTSFSEESDSYDTDSITDDVFHIVAEGEYEASGEGEDDDDLRSTTLSESTQKVLESLFLDAVAPEHGMCVYDCVWKQVGLQSLTGLASAPSSGFSNRKFYGNGEETFDLWQWLVDRDEEELAINRWTACGCTLKNEKLRSALRPLLRRLNTILLRIYDLNSFPQIILMLVLPILCLCGAAFLTVGFIMAIVQRWYHVGVVVVLIGMVIVLVGAIGAIGATTLHWAVLLLYAAAASAIAVVGTVPIILPPAQKKSLLTLVLEKMWSLLMPFQQQEVQNAWSCCGFLSADDSTWTCPKPRTESMLTSADDSVCGVTAIPIGMELRNVTTRLRNETVSIAYADDATPCMDVAVCYLHKYWVWWNPLYWVLSLICIFTALLALIVTLRPIGGVPTEEVYLRHEEEVLGDESESDDDNEAAEEEEMYSHVYVKDMTDAAYAFSGAIARSSSSSERLDTVASSCDDVKDGEFDAHVSSTDALGLTLGVVNLPEKAFVVTEVLSGGALARSSGHVVHIGDRLIGINGNHMVTDEGGNASVHVNGQSSEIDELIAVCSQLGIRVTRREENAIETISGLVRASSIDDATSKVTVGDQILHLVLTRLRDAPRPLILRFRKGDDPRAVERSTRKAARVERSKQRAERRAMREARTARNRSRTWQECNIAAARIQAEYRRWMTRRAIDRLRQFNRWKKCEPFLMLLRSLLWIVVGAYTAFMMYICLLYGLKFQSDVAKGWLISSSIALGVDIFVSQPIIALRGVLVQTARAMIKSQSWIPRTHFKRTFWRLHDMVQKKKKTGGA